MSPLSSNGDQAARSARAPEDEAAHYVLRLGGMALRNGLLIHGPTSWAAAARDQQGEIQVASGRKPVLAPDLAVRLPLLRGPLRLAEAFLLIPTVRMKLRAARLPFEDVRVIAAMFVASSASRALRRRPASATGELVQAALGLAPGDGRAQRPQPRRLPRRRAQGDRRLRGRIGRPGLRHQGARALWLQPGRADAGALGGRPAAARARCSSSPGPWPAPRSASRVRRVAAEMFAWSERNPDTTAPGHSTGPATRSSA